MVDQEVLVAVVVLLGPKSIEAVVGWAMSRFEATSTSGSAQNETMNQTTQQPIVSANATT